MTKKMTMRLVKFVVDLFPDSVKGWMRKRRWLHNLYSKGLQKSHTFYGVPSQRRLNKLFKRAMVRQSDEINQLSTNFSEKLRLSVGIFLTGNEVADTKGVEHILRFKEVEKVTLFGDDIDLGFVSGLKQGDRVEIWTSEGETGLDTEKPCLLLKSTDRLHKESLKVFLTFWSLEENRNGIIYCDRDSINRKYQRSCAECLPDWNPDLQLSSGYVHTGVMFSGNELYKHFFNTLKSPSVDSIAVWITKLYLDNPTVSVAHIPLSLLHQTEKISDRWFESLTQIESKAFEIVPKTSSGLAALKWKTIESPLVTLIIPTKNAKELVKTCIDSIITKTSYKNFEIILVDNNSDDSDALSYFDELNRHDKISVVKYPLEFNYSAINNYAVSHAKGQIIGLINNDVEVISPDWLTYMVGHVCRKDIGCVGAKLLYPDDRIQHAGVVLGYGGGAGHAHKYFPRDHLGYLNRIESSNNFSAVTAACLLVEKSDFLAVNGLNEQNLTVAFNDVDFCLKVLELGRRNLYCAEAELYHYESISRGADDTKEKFERFHSELSYLQQRWHNYIAHDPAYNKNLTLRRENFVLAE